MALETHGVALVGELFVPEEHVSSPQAVPVAEARGWPNTCSEVIWNFKLLFQKLDHNCHSRRVLLLRFSLRGLFLFFPFSLLSCPLCLIVVRIIIVVRDPSWPFSASLCPFSDSLCPFSVSLCLFSGSFCLFFDGALSGFLAVCPFIDGFLAGLCLEGFHANLFDRCLLF